MSLSFENKTVIVTGAAGGLGLAIAKAFAAQGANLVITDIDDKRLAECPASFDVARTLVLKVDGTDDAAVDGMIKTAVGKFGRIDVLVNNAAVNDFMEPVGDCSRAMWDKNLLVNLTAPFISSQLAVRQFLAQEPAKGVILNVISAAGASGFRAGCAYTASKHGLVGLTKNTAAFYGSKGIRCVAIMPGAMMTGMGHDASKYHKEGRDMSASTFAAGLRWNPLEEVAKTVMVLCSDGMDTVNGACVNTDNGWTAI